MVSSSLSLTFINLFSSPPTYDKDQLINLNELYSLYKYDFYLVEFFISFIYFAFRTNLISVMRKYILVHLDLFLFAQA
jgi:hypothetical protein